MAGSLVTAIGKALQSPTLCLALLFTAVGFHFGESYGAWKQHRTDAKAVVNGGTVTPSPNRPILNIIRWWRSSSAEAEETPGYAATNQEESEVSTVGFYVVLGLIFLGVFILLGKSATLQTAVKSALPASVSSVAVTAAVDAANVANNAAVDAVKLNLDALGKWYPSETAKAALKTLADENETFRAVKS